VNRVVGVVVERARSPGQMSLEVQGRKVGDGTVSAQGRKVYTVLRSWMMMKTWPTDGRRTTAEEGCLLELVTRERQRVFKVTRDLSCAKSTGKRLMEFALPSVNAQRLKKTGP